MPIETGAETAERGAETLLSDASPEIYRQNAFRVTGLHVDATGREVSRQVQ
ncbi:MAG TPA: hypothetical protein VLF66_09695 [Thermoanaerobaculia bacterium]|nr:hypothetical protein [Thermoanaerobaculia bacterium]